MTHALHDMNAENSWGQSSVPLFSHPAVMVQCNRIRRMRKRGRGDFQQSERAVHSEAWCYRRMSCSLTLARVHRNLRLVLKAVHRRLFGASAIRPSLTTMSDQVQSVQMDSKGTCLFLQGRKAVK